MWNSLPGKIRRGDIRALSRAISLVENEAEGYEKFLQELPYNSSVKIIGITGPPGAGKSTLVDCLISEFVANGERTAILCIDPSSAFTGGALLGDRIRMREWYDHPQVFIRSLSSRGTLGGLTHGIVEITDIMRTFPCDHIIVETVGVGQSEIAIVELADTTVVVQVPESGDDIQTMKAGLMEIADIFVVNKCDRPNADAFVRNLHSMLQGHHQHISIIKTAASLREGIKDLAAAIAAHEKTSPANDHVEMLVKRAMQLILNTKMRQVDKDRLKKMVTESYRSIDFNLYKLVSAF